MKSKEKTVFSGGKTGILTNICHFENKSVNKMTLLEDENLFFDNAGQGKFNCPCSITIWD